MLPGHIRSCFVTGGTGFIGSHLVDLLIEQGWEVRCLVRNPESLGWLTGKPIALYSGDLDSTDVLREGISGADAVFHLAGATAAGSREEYFRINAIGCRNVGEAALKCPDPPQVVAYVSSLAAVGPSQPGKAVDEDTPPSPLTDYGRSKLEGEKTLRAMGDLPLIVLRPPAVYGPRDRETLAFFRLASRGFFPVVGGGAEVSLIHVRDLVRGIVLAAERSPTGGTYFLAHDEPVVIADLSVHLAGALGRKVRNVTIPVSALWTAAAASELLGRVAGRLPVFNREKVKELAAPGWVCNTGKARRELSFQAIIDTASGIRETTDWYLRSRWIR